MQLNQRMLLDCTTDEALLCPCCRKRYRPAGWTKCGTCGGSEPKMCTDCRQRPVKSGRKWCDECLGKSRASIDLPGEWRRRVDNSMSGLRQRARHNNIIEVATIGEVATLLKQQAFRCALSGVVLQPDRSAALGHKIPASAGGGYDVSNLFWITYDLNKLMGTRDVDSFVDLCGKVAGNYGKLR